MSETKALTPLQLENLVLAFRWHEKYVMALPEQKSRGFAYERYRRMRDESLVAAGLGDLIETLDPTTKVKL